MGEIRIVVQVKHADILIRYARKNFLIRAESLSYICKGGRKDYDL